jgi:hypothetical protein
MYLKLDFAQADNKVVGVFFFFFFDIMLELAMPQQQACQQFPHPYKGFARVSIRTLHVSLDGGNSQPNNQSNDSLCSIVTSLLINLLKSCAHGIIF